jgi:hypothetical protein
MLCGLPLHQMDIETSEVYKIANSKFKLGNVHSKFTTHPNSDDYRMRLKSRKKIGG